MKRKQRIAAPVPPPQAFLAAMLGAFVSGTASNVQVPWWVAWLAEISMVFLSLYQLKVQFAADAMKDVIMVSSSARTAVAFDVFLVFALAIVDSCFVRG